jgi:hypothetical protein
MGGKRTLSSLLQGHNLRRMMEDDETDEDRTETRAYIAAASLADLCGQLRSFDSEVGRDPTGHLINYLMTELWDHGFSQSEIRAAFMDALSDMNRYAAGEERRS